MIHMEDKLTTVLIPQNSYPQIQKALQMSNTPVLALGGNFSPTADSHLVAVQRDDDQPSTNPMNNRYKTEYIFDRATLKGPKRSFVIVVVVLGVKSSLRNVCGNKKCL